MRGGGEARQDVVWRLWGPRDTQEPYTMEEEFWQANKAPSPPPTTDASTEATDPPPPPVHTYSTDAPAPPPARTYMEPATKKIDSIKGTSPRETEGRHPSQGTTGGGRVTSNQQPERPSFTLAQPNTR